jgi:hypothetical protein
VRCLLEWFKFVTLAFYFKFVTSAFYFKFGVSLDCPFLIAPSIFCNIYLNFIFLLNERIYLFWKQTISHLIKSLKKVRKSNINYCKCTIEKVHETNRMLKPQIWNRMLKSQIWNRMLKSQICITQVNTSQSKHLTK